MNPQIAKPTLFVALVHETLKQASYETRGDLVEAVKRRAARLRLRYDSAIVGEAIDQVERVRGPLWPASSSGSHRAARPAETPAITASEAHDILVRLAQVSAVKAMGDTVADQAHERRVRDQAALIESAVYRGEIRPRRRPVRERLAAIFAPESQS